MNVKNPMTLEYTHMNPVPLLLLPYFDPLKDRKLLSAIQLAGVTLKGSERKFIMQCQ